MKRTRSSSPMPPSKGSSSSNASKLARDASFQIVSQPFAPQIPLTKLEQELFNLLLDVVATQDDSNCTLRVAGGWVRDKILYPDRDMGLKVDIDIALDTLLGNQFAHKVNNYLSNKGLSNATIAVIQKNPDQSKHLETARMRILNVWLDFVNLRTETYSHDSRIPDIDIGTPKEDALRRDLTINALFYNMGTCQIEDFTGHGLKDIQAKLVRTPLPPLTTLLDDPLRSLRAVRFAARLNFSLSPDLVEACRNSRVHDALDQKVSRERVSAELDRSYSDQNPPHALALLVELGLFSVVFRLPSQQDILVSTDQVSVSSPPPTDDLPAASLSALLNLHSLPAMQNCPAPSRLAQYAVTLSPLAGTQCYYSPNGKKPKLVPITNYIMRSELRLATKDVADVCLMHTTALKLKSLVHKGCETLNRLETGSVIREAGPYWRSALQVALVMELPNPVPADTYINGYKQPTLDRLDERRVLIKNYDEFRQRVEDMGLDGVWDVKPVVNGNQLVQLLPGLKKGPMIGQIIKEQIDWMIENPGNDAEQVKGWLKTKYAQFVQAKS